MLHQRYIGLSTPSLGITAELRDQSHHSVNERFQLPLSGSPVSTTVMASSSVNFQLPSRDHTAAASSSGTTLTVTSLSTPSLGITGVSKTSNVSEGYQLSTPSLGITEPYSGIFRLSAAFRRGAPSHICIFRPLFEDITATEHHDSNRGFKRNSRCTFVIWCTMEPATCCGQPLYPRSWPESGTRLLITHRRQRAG